MEKSQYCSPIVHQIRCTHNDRWSKLQIYINFLTCSSSTYQPQSNWNIQSRYNHILWRLSVLHKTSCSALMVHCKCNLLHLKWHNCSCLSVTQLWFGRNYKTTPSQSFRPTLAPLAIPRLNMEIKRIFGCSWDSNPQPCSKLHVFGLCVVCCWWLA